MTNARHEVLKPAVPKVMVKSVMDVVKSIGDSVYFLDITIDQLSQQLNRAQPHRMGRLAISFSKSQTCSVDGVRIYEVVPVVGKMILLQSGSWVFIKLNKTEKFKKLSDLRVGKTLKSDPLVVTIIDKIEELLKQRVFLISRLKQLTLNMTNTLSSIDASCAKNGEHAVDLSYRVKLDWSKGASEAEEKIKSDRRLRYESQKAKAIAKKLVVEGSPTVIA
jgi:hypothetical protein